MRLKSAPDVGKSLREIAVKAVGTPGFSMAGGLPPGLEHTAHFTPAQSAYSNGTHVAEVEVDRYVTMPGQALSYKIGQFEIERQREAASAGARERFSLPGFHDRLLSPGSLPLAALRRAPGR